MKKKLSALLLVLVLVLTTMVSGLSAISANASGNEEAAVKQEEVIKTEKNNVEKQSQYENDVATQSDAKPIGLEDEPVTNSDAKVSNIQAKTEPKKNDTEKNNVEKQSQYENDVATQSDTKPIGLENEPVTNSDAKVSNTQAKTEPKKNDKDITASDEPDGNATEDPDAYNFAKIMVNKSWEDNMDGFAPKIELINKADGTVLFTLEKGKMPAFQKDEGTVTIDTGKHLDNNLEFILKINDEPITVTQYAERPVEITVDGQKYEAQTNIWYNYAFCGGRRPLMQNPAATRRI